MITPDRLQISMPGTPTEALEHLVAEHGWQPVHPDPTMLAAHALAHASDSSFSHDHTQIPAAPSERHKPWAHIPTTAAGLGLIAVGLFLPWISGAAPLIERFERSGLDTVDGKIIGVLVVVMSLLTAREFRAPRSWSRRLVGVAACGVGAAIWADWMDLLHRIDELSLTSLEPTVGSGLYLCAIGVGLTVAGGWLRSHTLAPGALLTDLSKHRKPIASVAIVTIAALGAKAGWAQYQAFRHPPIKDADIGDCKIDTARVTVLITNRTDSSKSYVVRLKMTDQNDAFVSSGTASAAVVEPGETIERTADMSSRNTFKYCEVVDVQRF